MALERTRACALAFAVAAFALAFVHACGGIVSEPLGTSRAALTDGQRRVLGFEAPTADWTASSGIRTSSTR